MPTMLPIMSKCWFNGIDLKCIELYKLEEEAVLHGNGTVVI